MSSETAETNRNEATRRVRAVYAVAMADRLGFPLRELRRLRMLVERGGIPRKPAARSILDVLYEAERRNLLGQPVDAKDVADLGPPDVVEALSVVSRVIQPMSPP